ncbi:PEP/pyruvate-binding domain-containing protein [Desulfosporosinus sp. OT]|uniref:PEP/pyruvate-binding domain-containing protein n=1 Tax=Desulfosporosinus sp. OT TaxID=913865 RepID=UPI000223A985|nr:PEP/pyruvate-binding domain-containing protein [Desulfosporosinus sp. OT]EGW37030.1 PEP-utilizing enzyme, mobile domain protein [Desulfosporosinus sp. OT]
MKELVCLFKELKTEHKHLAGGKGGTLAHLFQKGYPVPDGLIIMPMAFQKDELIPEAGAQLQACLKAIRERGGETSFAVRSSALSEDSAMASFAGQFDTVLDVSTDHEIQKAIRTVRKSRYSKEVQVYSEAKGIDESHDMAVVIQQMVKADISGVLFTADPVTGNRNEMAGNFIFGLGEKLVSGQVSAYTFKLGRKTGSWRRGGYDGPLELKKFAAKLAKLGNSLEREMDCPQDIEWAIADGTLYLLQSRPVTTLIGDNPVTGERNDSRTGNYLWSNVNFGEAIPQVMTPLTWSIQQQIYESWQLLPGYQSSGNIGGRIYLNLSIYASVLTALGKNKQGITRFLEGLLYTRIPESLEIPLIPLSMGSRVAVLINFVGMIMKQIRAVRELPRFLSVNADWCEKLQKQIHETNKKAELTFLWHTEILPHLQNTVWSVMGSVTQFSDYTIKLRRELIELLGPEDADTFISGLSSSTDIRDGSGLLASLGPVLGIAKVARREIDRTEYLAQYGHRGPNEFELSVPRPAEDSGWLDQQLAQFEKSPIDVEALLIKQRAEIAAAWNRLEISHPRKMRSMKRRINQVAPKACLREAVRSEYVRDRWVARKFALHAGQLTGLGDDIFFLTIEEVLDVLSGDEAALKLIAARKDIHSRYSSLPVYPSIICGRFDPFQWVADPERRHDIYVASGFTSAATSDSSELNDNLITGSAGSAGRFEGVVRRLDSPEEGDQLQKGEILVTSQTDIAWTPLFPRAGAIVTDVGAPLSHAAIVARELGIPAVVGCGNATRRLKTGDRVLVDGGQGVVSIKG